MSQPEPRKLFKAIEEKDLKAIRKFLREGGSANAVHPKSYYRDTALIKAADTGCAQIVRELLLHGAIVDKTNSIDDTALIDAARYGCQDVLEELLKSGASVNKKNQEGDTALMCAAKSGHREAVQVLLKAGADVTIRNKNGMTALTIAADSPVLVSKEEIVSHLKEAEKASLVQRSFSLSIEQQDKPEKVTVRRGKSAPETFLRIKEMRKRIKSRSTADLLVENSSLPGVTFLGEPQVKKITHAEEQYDFDCGVALTVPSTALKSGSVSRITVQPGFAPDNVFAMPTDIESGSPSFLVSSSGDDFIEPVTLSMEHSFTVENEEDAQNLLFLEADATPDVTTSKSIYEFKELPEAHSQFTPEENKGKLSIRQRISQKFVKIGFRRDRCLHTQQSTASSQSASPVKHIYTMRVYRSPAQAAEGRKMALIAVSLYGKVYSKFLSHQQGILKDYPEISTEQVDWTVFEPLNFTEAYAELKYGDISGWVVHTDTNKIFKSAVDFPLELENIEDLSSYPPRIICTFSVKQSRINSNSCCISMTGFNREVSVNMPLPCENLQEETLKKATEQLKATLLKVKSITHTKLGTAVLNVVEVAEKLITALSSYSLEVIVRHTNMFENEINVISTLTRAAAANCANSKITADINACLTTLTSKSHQFCHIAKVKLRYCQGGSERNSAIADLVDSGAGVIKSINFLFQDLHILHTIISSQDTDIYEPPETPDHSIPQYAPEASKEYKTLVQNSVILCDAISKDPKSLAVALFGAQIIPKTSLDEIIELNETKTFKGHRLYTALLAEVKRDNSKFSEFVNILKMNSSLYSDVLALIGVHSK